MTGPYAPRGNPVWQDQVGYEDEDGDGYSSTPTTTPTQPSTDSGTSVQPGAIPPYSVGAGTQNSAATGPTTTAAPGSGQNQPDPTAPLTDGSGNVKNVLTGPAQTTAPTSNPGSYVPPPSPSNGQLFGDAKTDLQNVRPTQTAPENQYTQDFHNFTEDDYKQNKEFQDDPGKYLNEHGLGGLGDISKNDQARLKFGTEEPDALTGAQNASKNGNARLSQFANSINSGDIDAVGKADDILKQGEPGLAFFKFFAPAYSDWTGAGVTYADLMKEYQAEYGMSFAAYSGDTKTLADITEKVEDITQGLNNSYNTLVPQWSGAAAQAFEQKMAAFFQAAGTVTQDLGVVGKDVTALVQGLQQLILAKAQTVAQIYLDTLPTGIDGVMASTMVKVAKGQADKGTNLIAFQLLGGTIEHDDGWSLGDIAATVVTGGAYAVGKTVYDQVQQSASEDAANQAAPGMAAQWCNEVLKPQFEAREQALHSVDTETKARIQQGFQAFTQQFANIQDPFVGMDKVGNAKPATPKPTQPASPGGNVTMPAGTGNSTAPAGSTGTPTAPVTATPSINTGAGAGAGTGAGTGSPQVTLPSSLTGNGAGTSTTPQGTGTNGLTLGTTGTGGLSTGGLNTGGTDTTRPTGLPTGAGWIPAGVPLPNGWKEDPTTGQILPPGWKTDPATGLPVGPNGTTTAGAGTGTGLGAGAGKIDPKDDVHKNKDGSVSLGEDKSVTIGTEGKKGVFSITDTDADGTKHTYHVHFDDDGNPVVTEVVPKDGTDLQGLGTSGLTDAGTTTIAGAGGGGGGIGGGGSIGGGGIGGGGGTTTVGDTGAHGAGGHGAHGAGGGNELQAGAQVGADNSAMSATGSAPSNDGSPVAGAAAGGGASGHQGGATTPFLGGAGRGGGGGGGEESARKYAHKEDLIGEADLEEWQRMGPVIGEN